MTLTGVMALILRYFTEFGSSAGALRKSGWRCRRKNHVRYLISWWVSCSYKVTTETGYVVLDIVGPVSPTEREISTGDVVSELETFGCRYATVSRPSSCWAVVCYERDSTGLRGYPPPSGDRRLHSLS